MSRFLRVLTEAVSEATDSGLIGPTPDPQSQSTSTPIAPEDDGVNWFGWIFLVLFLLAALGAIAYGAYYAWSWFEMKRKRQEYADDPEKQIKHKELDFIDKNKLKKWAMNVEDPHHVNEVKCEEIEVHHELFIKAEFTQPLSQVKTIISNNPIDAKNKENVYFEVEIEAIEPGVEVVIGLLEKADHKQEELPGRSKEAVGFSSKDGSVMKAGKELYKCGFKGEFGDTLGMGVTCPAGQVWVFHNGVFLNEPLPDTVNAAKDPYEYKKQLNDRSEWEKKKKEKEMRLITVPKQHPYHIAIGTTGPCTLMVNIGGAMFRNFNKEIAQGLI